MGFSFSPEQLQTYLNYIGLPEPSAPTKEYLERLHTHQIGHLPYTNVALHYGPMATPPNHALNLDPAHLFEKLVMRGVYARQEHRNDKVISIGGYCMENSPLFYYLLKALGFNVYMAGVRIRYRKDGIPHGDYIGWVHTVNIVTFVDGSRYSCDVSFGGDGPIRPLPMIHSDEDGFEPPIIQNLGSQQVRLVREHIPSQTYRTPENRVWVYQYRNGAEKPWNAFYAITETEFMPADFEIMSFYTSQSPRSPQTSSLLVIKFLLGEKQKGEQPQINGKLMLVHDTLKRNMGGRTETLLVCPSEQERVNVLREWFGIYLTEEEVKAIRGRVAEVGQREASVHV